MFLDTAWGCSEAADAHPSCNTRGWALMRCARLPALQLQTPTNVASIVVHQALAKSLDRHNTAMNARPAYLQQQQQQQQQQQAAAPGGRQQPGAAYQVQPGPSELTYDELTVRALFCC